MKTFLTELRASDPKTGQIKTWCGPNVQALTWGFAEKYCQENGLGYCKVVGELVAEIDADSDDFIRHNHDAN